MRKSGDDIKFETLYHGCIHSHTKNIGGGERASSVAKQGNRPGQSGKRADNADKQDRQTRTRLEQGWTRRRCQADPDKACTRTTPSPQQRSKQGESPRRDHSYHGPFLSFFDWGTRGCIVFRSPRGAGGQEEDNSRTTGHVQGHGQRLWCLFP